MTISRSCRFRPGSPAALVALALALAAAAGPAGAPPAFAQEAGATATQGPGAAATQGADVAATQEAPATPSIEGSTVLLARDVARLELELSSGETRSIALDDGRVRIDGEAAGTYEPGGAFERAWRELLRDPVFGEPEALGPRLAEWEPPTGVAEPGSGAAAILAALDRYDPRAAPVPAPTATGPSEHVTIAPRAGSIRQLADRMGALNETLARISDGQLRLDGDFALVVHDDYRIADGTTIEGDVALLGGRLVVGGNIEGDVLVLGGEFQLEPGSTVSGDVRSFGGEVETAGATVTGEILTLSAPDDAPDRPSVDARSERSERREWRSEHRDRGFFASVWRNVTRTLGDLVGTLVWLASLTLIGALLVYFARDRLDVVAREARADVLRSFGVGLAGQFLFFPVLFLLAVLIVTIPIIPFYLAAVAIAVPAGYLAVARGLGEAVVDRRYEFFERYGLNRQNTYYYVLNGLILLLSPFAVAALLQLFGDWLGFLRALLLFGAVVLNWTAATTGLGAVLLTRGGGLIRDFGGFRRRRSVPLDDIESVHRPGGTPGSTHDDTPDATSPDASDTASGGGPDTGDSDHA